MKKRYLDDSGPQETPFRYEIRVKGRLDGARWQDWFENLRVVQRRGETILSGQALDQSALYGLLARLRDLAVPLVAVRVLDAKAQSALQRKARLYDVLLTSAVVLVYLLLLGALTTFTVFLAEAINVALALLLLFSALAGLAQAFFVWNGGRYWRWVVGIMFVAALICLLVYIPTSNIMPTTIALSITLVLSACLLVVLLVMLRRRIETLKEGLFCETSADGDPSSSEPQTN